MRWFLLFLSLIPLAHNDSNQTGANTSEVLLSPANVTAAKFRQTGFLCRVGLYLRAAAFHIPTGDNLGGNFMTY